MFDPIIGSDYPAKVIPLIRSAKKNIDIVMFDWRWYPDQPAHPVQKFNIEIANAVGRGVQIRAVLNHSRIVEQLNKLKVKTHRMSDKRVVHTKLILIDDEVVVVGSHNITRNAFTSNHETSLAVSIPPESARFRQFFENLWNL